jgi:hypothetical protein
LDIGIEVLERDVVVSVERFECVLEPVYGIVVTGGSDEAVALLGSIGEVFELLRSS